MKTGRPIIYALLALPLLAPGALADDVDYPTDVGVVPHELVEYRPEDLAAGVDTLIARAEELLADFPGREVPYDPAAFGWGE